MAEHFDKVPDELSESTTENSADVPAISLEAQVAHMTARRDEVAAALSAAQQGVHLAEDAFLAGHGSADALAAAQNCLVGHTEALAAVDARLAPLASQLAREQADARRVAARAAERRRLVDLAEECARHLRTLHETREAGVTALEGALMPYLTARTALLAAQDSFFDDLAGFVADGRHGFADSGYLETARALNRLARDGVDLTGVKSSLGRPTTATRMGSHEEVTFRGRGPFGSFFDHVAAIAHLAS